jgi:membrane associated rhomboid family serine protease
MSPNPVESEASCNGPAGAAILATGIGCAALGVLAFSADASPAIGSLLNLYNPTGTLSGVTTGAILVWLAAWFVLSRLWRVRTIALARINVIAFLLLTVGFILTFPPAMDLLQGK